MDWGGGYGEWTVPSPREPHRSLWGPRGPTHCLKIQQPWPLQPCLISFFKNISKKALGKILLSTLDACRDPTQGR